ncbi:hypothetical protein, partial [Lacticaseibacillus paracasei]|uniref:hypothetical protein n=1 Tax=Lacticaseibacillus paracasei TaxID=1597 RepID=UPI0021AA81E6
HAITTDAWRNSLDHYQEFVIIVALDLKIEEQNLIKTIFRFLRKPANTTFNQRILIDHIHLNP